MQTYPETLKQSMASKLLTPGGPSALSLSRKTGISQTSLSRWARIYIKGEKITLSNGQKRPQDFTREERLEALVASGSLKGPELGMYLRKMGLTTAHLEKWKHEYLSVGEERKVGRPPLDREVKALKKENKFLKRDLNKKDKALAEAAALLILKKKAQEIWGKAEDEE